MCVYILEKGRERLKERERQREELERVLFLCGSVITVMLAFKIHLVGFNDFLWPK